MKIAFIGQKGIPAHGGGVENYVDQLAVRLAKQGHDVTVYTRPSYTPRSLRTYRGVRLISLPSIPTKSLDTIIHTALATLHVLFRRVDVIHYHSIGPSSLLWLPRLLKPRTAVVATFQSQCYLHRKWGSFARRYLLFGEYVLCRFADAVITPSRTLAQRALQRYQREAVRIPNGVHMPGATIDPELLQQFGLNPGSYVLAVSRLVEHKGIHYLIEAFKQLETDKKLVIVGDSAFTDEYAERLRALAQGNKRIMFVGAQSGVALDVLYAHAYAFVQPSDEEGFSIALLEAMSFGLPIVSSNIAANKEVLQTAGCYFEAGNVEELRQRLSDVLAQPDAARHMGAAARQVVEAQYDWDALVHTVAQVYESARLEKAGFARPHKRLKRLGYHSQTKQ